MVFSQERCTFLMIPSSLDGFNNADTTTEISRSGRNVYCFNGTLDDDMDRTCGHCGSRMHVNNHLNVELRHLGFGGALSVVRFRKLQLRCPKCGSTILQEVPFKAEHHRITQDLYTYTRDLLALGNYTNRQVAQITGLDENIVKTIDKRRLQEKYTIDGKELIQPEQPARILGIDEFKLHNGYARLLFSIQNTFLHKSDIIPCLCVVSQQTRTRHDSRQSPLRCPTRCSCTDSRDSRPRCYSNLPECPNTHDRERKALRIS